MKIKIDGFNIDLREVVYIGPIRNDHNNTMTDHNEIRGLGCFVFFKNRNSLWLNLADRKIDPYQLDDSKNALARAEAQQNYDLLMNQWKAED